MNTLVHTSYVTITISLMHTIFKGTRAGADATDGAVECTPEVDIRSLYPVQTDWRSNGGGPSTETDWLISCRRDVLATGSAGTDMPSLRFYNSARSG